MNEDAFPIANGDVPARHVWKIGIINSADHVTCKTWSLDSVYDDHTWLGDGFIFFDFHPENSGRFPIWRAHIFQMGWWKTTNQMTLEETTFHKSSIFGLLDLQSLWLKDWCNVETRNSEALCSSQKVHENA